VRLRRLRPGKLRVDLVSPSGDVLASRVIPLAAGDNGTRRIELQEGTVEFRIRPYALVTLDGKPLGQTPLTVTALEGPHRIVLANKELGREVELTHVFKAGQRTIVKYFFED
jgi:serine/threonine-protein kinase